MRRPAWASTSPGPQLASPSSLGPGSSKAQKAGSLVCPARDALQHQQSLPPRWPHFSRCAGPRVWGEGSRAPERGQEGLVCHV